jgi:hypothetical protein
MLQGGSLADVGFDAVALKPTEVAVERAADLDVDCVTVDYEGREQVPSAATLSALAETAEVRVTTPVRATGFDPLGDDDLARELPPPVRRVLVAGHSAYLDERECQRAVAPRLHEAVTTSTDPWVGTEGVERLAMAVGGTQYELLGPGVGRQVRALRAVGFDGGVAVYAPTVLTADEDAALDALGAYAARRGPVAERLPGDGPTDATATGRTRDVLSRAVREYGVVGDRETVRERVAALHDAGVDCVVAYPARGLNPFL